MGCCVSKTKALFCQEDLLAYMCFMCSVCMYMYMLRLSRYTLTNRTGQQQMVYLVSSVTYSRKTHLILEDCDPELFYSELESISSSRFKDKNLLPTDSLPAQPPTPPTHHTPTPILPFLCVSSLPFIKQKQCPDKILQTGSFLSS